MRTTTRQKTPARAQITISHSEYESLLKKQRVIPLAKLTPTERRALQKARDEITRGEYLTLPNLQNALGGSHK